MLIKYKKQAKNAVGIGLVITIALLTDPKDNIWESGIGSFLMLTCMGSFWFSFWAYAKAKGYSGFIGLVLPLLAVLGRVFPMPFWVVFFRYWHCVLGLIILLGLRDKHPESASDAGTTKLPDSKPTLDEKNQELKRLNDSGLISQEVYLERQRKLIDDKVQITTSDKPQSEVEEIESSICLKCGYVRKTNETHCPNCGIKYEKYSEKKKIQEAEKALESTEDKNKADERLKVADEVPKFQEESKSDESSNKDSGICPKCGHVWKTNDLECPKCGIIYKKYKGKPIILEEPKTEEVLKDEEILRLKEKLEKAEGALKTAEEEKKRIGPQLLAFVFKWLDISELKMPKFIDLCEKKLHGESEKYIPSLSPDDFRVHGESFILCISLILFLTLLIALSSASLSIVPKASLSILPILIIVSVFLIKTKQGQLLGQSVKVSEHQLPDVYAVSKKVASRLDMPMPDIFVTQNPVINASAIGFLGKKSVVLNSKTVEAMTNEELTYILGHEFAHIKCNHTEWMVITSSTESVRIPILSSFFSFIFLFWSRKAEYTADRGGLIASKDLNASITALLKVAVGEKLVSQMDIHRILQQLEEGDVIHILSEILGTHPYTLNRIRYLKDFYQSKPYKRIQSFIK